MKKTIFLYSTVFFFVCVFNLHPQIKDRYATKDTWEISGSFSIKSDKYVSNGEEGSAYTTVDVMPYVGYFATDGLELGIIPVISLQDFGGYDRTDLTLYFAPSYNLSSRSGIHPYFQGAIGYASVSGKSMTTVSGLAWRLETGLKFNPFSRALIKFGLNYGQKTLESSNKVDSGRDGLNSINFTAGFGIFFK